MRKYNRAVFIGRFQPIHSAHVATINKALEIADRVLILIGSANVAPNIRNPWSYEDRTKMILANFPGLEDRISFKPLNDHLYNDTVWATQVQNAVAPQHSERIALIGAAKDFTSFYLNILPFLERVETPICEGIDATRVREKMFENIRSGFPPVPARDFPIDITERTSTFIHEWAVNNWDEAERLSREYYFIRNYKTAWSTAPYPPTFVTVDAVVVCGGYVLMVRRKAAPGEGLLALPGGFIGQTESLIDACIRELREETKLKVPAPVLKGSLKQTRVFDHPLRSLRGRTITHAFYFELTDQALPKVKGGDDAASAHWVALNEFVKMQRETYEDHAHIIEYFTGVNL